MLKDAAVATRLPAQDLDRARAWYADKLGLEPSDEREGGLLYLTEFHPFTWVFGDDDLTVEYDYFHDPEGESFGDGEQGSYADLSASTSHNTTREWAHSLADVLGAVLGAGLRIELYNEHDYTLFPRWPDLESGGGTLGAAKVYRRPAGEPRLPLMFSLRARR